MILPDMPNLAEIAFLMHQMEEELEIQTRIVKARGLDAGSFDDALATETVNYLIGGDAGDVEGINLMSIVLRTVLRRIDVQGITSTDEAAAQWFTDVWGANDMDIKQGDVHRWAERDGEAFVIVDYNQAKERPWEPGQFGVPEIFIHERYTSAEAAWRDEVGSNEGCKAHYRNNDRHQPLEMVSKRWVETTYENNEPITRQRMTLYIAAQPQTAARIEKYVMNDAGEWEQLTESTYDKDGNEIAGTWPVWWTEDGTETGKSLPLPVIHFTNEEWEPITKRVWGMQDGMDHAWSSLLGNLVMAGHPLLAAFGFYPTTDGKPPESDGSNLMKVAPRQIIGTAERGPGEAAIDSIEPGDPKPTLDAMDKIAIFCSFVAGLPINNFIISKAVASGSTLRQGEADLVAHVNALVRMWSKGWANVLLIARKLDTIYGSGSHDETAVPKAIFAPVETVNVENVNKAAAAQHSTGIPWQWIAREVWGYSEAEIKEMEQLKAQMETAGEQQNTDSGGDAAVS